MKKLFVQKQTAPKRCLDLNKKGKILPRITLLYHNFGPDLVQKAVGQVI